MENSENLEGEVWVTHPIGIMVSNMGRVWTARKGKWYGSDRGHGYLRVYWKGNAYYVHILVAQCFLPNPHNLPTVDHLNRDKTDNRVENLRWADRSMQNKNREVDWEAKVANTDWKAIGEKLSIPILQLNKNLEVVKEWKSATEAEREGGFFQTNIIQCCKGRYKTSGGYVWRYKK